MTKWGHVFAFVGLSVDRMTQNVDDWWNFSEVWDVTHNSWLDFGADPDHDVEQEFFEGIFTIAVHNRQCWIVLKAGSAALAKWRN